jgi:hypothetical protein
MNDVTPEKSYCVAFTKEDVEQSLPSRFRNIVRTFGAGTAIVSGDQCLTYDALDKASACLPSLPYGVC